MKRNTTDQEIMDCLGVTEKWQIEIGDNICKSCGAEMCHEDDDVTYWFCQCGRHCWAEGFAPSDQQSE